MIYQGYERIFLRSEDPRREIIQRKILLERENNFLEREREREERHSLFFFFRIFLSFFSSFVVSFFFFFFFFLSWWNKGLSISLVAWNRGASPGQWWWLGMQPTIAQMVNHKSVFVSNDCHWKIKKNGENQSEK